jgi:autotransporter adhesin
VADAATDGTAIGARAQATAANSIALGADSVADRADSVSVGSVGSERQLTNLAAGALSATSTDAVNGGQLFGFGDSMAQSLGGGASMGANGFSGPTYLIQGGNYYNVGDALGALDGAISGIDSRLSALETGTTTTEAAAPATASSGSTQQQVDDRGAGTDAQSGPARDAEATGTPSPSTGGPSTGGQSAPVAQAPVPAALDQETLDSANAYTDTTATKTLASANAYTDSKFTALDDQFQQLSDNLGNRLNQQDKRIDRMGAMSSAMMNMAMNAAGGRSERGRVAVGAGWQNGESALSVGYAKQIGDRASFSIGGAFSSDDSSAGIGFGFDL